MKTILVILDGLNDQVAEQTMGYLSAVCHAGKGRKYRMVCELPSLSRPLYECIITGVPPVDSGIVSNLITRQSNQTGIFQLARRAGLKTAAAAYHWVSELYNQTPFVPQRDRHTVDESLAIQYGHFYFEDSYPDSHLFTDAEHLRWRYQPDFLLVHSMNIDDQGHHSGLDSSEYRNTARRADGILSLCLPQWLEDGYQVLITADHGMNNDCSHGGTLEVERTVPFYVFGEAFSLSDVQPLQTQICGIVCDILGIQNHSKSNCSGILK